MHYQISRNGQTYGPYTLEDLQRYVASGNVLPTDLAKSEEMAEWLPVSQVLGGSAAAPQFPTPGFASPEVAYAQPAAAPVAQFDSAPNLHWGLVLLFGFLSCSLFMWVWNLVIAAWLKRVQPNATSLFFYLGATVLLFVQIAFSIVFGAHHVMQPGLHMYTGNPVGSLLGLCVWVVRLIARYSQRASLLEHFNTVEPVGLTLNPVMTFFFGGIYFQSKLNRIAEMKQFGMARPF